MSEQKREIEARGANVDAAVENGLRQLGLRRDAVEIIVLDEGSRGLLGIGARDAVVKLVVTAVAPPPPPAPKPAPAQPEPKPAPARSEPKPAPARPEPKPEPAKPEPKPEPPQPRPQPATAARAAVAVDDEDDEDEAFDATAVADEAEAEVAASVVSELLAHMDIVAGVSVRQTEPDDITGERVNVVDVEGDDLTILIGPRGETLDALQYVSRLMVGHRMRRRAQFVVDVEGYRARREQALSRLAERMAQKAITRQQPVSLEPMPAYDRRIIHMTLRNSDEVYTESAGEGNRRRVRIYPK